MYKNFKPYLSMLIWFTLGLTASLLFCKSLIVNWDMVDQASQTTERPGIHAPNLALSMHMRKRSQRAS